MSLVLFQINLQFPAWCSGVRSVDVIAIAYPRMIHMPEPYVHLSATRAKRNGQNLMAITFGKSFEFNQDNELSHGSLSLLRRFSHGVQDF
jgi:hypothetical protein